jgi:lipopolysaccharide biosynthesis protein
MRNPRLGVFAHYDPEGVVDEYVVRLVKALREVCDLLVFVSASPGLLPSNVHVDADLVIVRENRGFDFSSWKAGLDAVPHWDRFDEIVLCNDSVYGPLSSLSGAFDTMASDRCDFWGITDNREIDHHIQSYFVVFRAPVIRSEAFRCFWNQMRPLSDKWHVIVDYEVALSRTLIGAGFRPGTLFHDDILVRLHATRIAIQRCVQHVVHHPASLRRPNWVWQAKYRFNKTRYFWKDLIRRRMPFIKVDLFRLNPMNVSERAILRRVAASSDYPIELIEQHLRRTRRYYRPETPSTRRESGPVS